MYYTNMIQEMNELMRVNQFNVDQMNIHMSDNSASKIITGLLSASGTMYTMLNTLSEGVNLLIGKIQDVLTIPTRQEVIARSKQPYLALTEMVLKPTNSLERDLYFILNNTNSYLYENVNAFGQVFTNEKITTIGLKLKYLTGMSIAVVAVILLSGFVIVPLFGKIQNRILELMKLFFSIQQEIKFNIIGRIKMFHES